MRSSIFDFWTNIGTFYKDEGGKEKFLEYSVELKDARGLCTDREVPLRATLHYDIDDRPQANQMTNNGKQELMKMDNTLSMLLKNGKGKYSKRRRSNVAIVIVIFIS